MLHNVTRRGLALAVCGWLIAIDASALTVGRARGAVLIGRPLDLAIPVTLDGATEEPCASAEVFYGEERLRRDPVVRWEPGAAGQGVLRVTTPVPVDEPMITVYLRVGCGQSTTRRFVMLSELPPDNEPALPQAAPLPAQPPVAGAAPRGQAPLQAGTSPRGSTAAPGNAPAAAEPAPGPRRREAAAAAPAIAGLRAERDLPAARAQAGRPTAPAPETRARRPEPPANGRPRLKLEALDLGPERDPVLRLSSELRTEVAADPERRAAAAALWQALQKTPEDALREAIRLQAVERELKSLRDVTQQNAATVERMRTEVERARGERGIAGAVVGALSLLLLALLGWFGRRWYAEHRLKRVGRWFEQHGEAGVASAPRNPSGGLETQPAPILREGPPAPGGLASMGVAGSSGAAAPTWATVSTGGLASADALTAASGAAAAARSTPPPGPVTPAFPREDFQFQSSRSASMRTVGVEELIDVHDKADFFLSIGEYDQAITLLESHVFDDVETSALAWMDLLELYHSLGRRGDYERLRNEFRQRFNGQVPDFDHFDQPGAPLEEYDRALGHIVALWPSPRVLDLIEESIFRKPGLPGAEPFSLEAYRELVLLYHVAAELTQQPAHAPEAGAPATIFDDTAVHPLNLPEAVDIPLAPRERLMVPPASARLGVDIDLGELPVLADAPQDAPPSGASAEEGAPRELPMLDFDLDEPADAPPLQVRRTGP